MKVDGCEMRGLIAAAKRRAELGISDWSDEQAKGKMAIQYDKDDKSLVELRGSGWIKDCKEVWRTKKFRGLTSLDVKKREIEKWGRRERLL